MIGLNISFKEKLRVYFELSRDGEVKLFLMKSKPLDLDIPTFILNFFLRFLKSKA